MLLNEKSKRIIQVLMHENDVTLPLLTLMLPYAHVDVAVFKTDD